MKDNILKFRSSVNKKITDTLISKDLIQSLTIIYNDMKLGESCRFDTTFFYIEYKYYLNKKILIIGNVFKKNINERVEYLLLGIDNRKYKNINQIIRNILILDKIISKELFEETYIYFKDKDISDILETIQYSLNTSNQYYLEKVKSIYIENCKDKIDSEIKLFQDRINDEKKNFINYITYNTEKLNELNEFKSYLIDTFKNITLQEVLN
jgi:hypothetical protein